MISWLLVGNICAAIAIFVCFYIYLRENKELLTRIKKLKKENENLFGQSDLFVAMEEIRLKREGTFESIISKFHEKIKEIDKEIKQIQDSDLKKQS